MMSVWKKHLTVAGDSKSLSHKEAAKFSNPGADRYKGYLDTTFYIYLNFIVSKEARLWVHFAVDIQPGLF